MSGAKQNSCHEFQWVFGNLSSPAETKVLNRVGHLTVALLSICIINQFLKIQFKMHQVLIKNNPLLPLWQSASGAASWYGLAVLLTSHTCSVSKRCQCHFNIICRNSCQVHHISDIKRSLDQIDSVATHSRNPFCCTCSEPCNLLWNMANVAQNVLLCMDSTSITSIRLSARQRDRNAQNEWWTRTRPRDFAMALTLQQNVTRPRNHKKSRMHVDSRVTWN